ncbi:histidine kinase [Methylobacterium sp. M6A4_1b]
MADYYPLLARALDAMPDRSPALRQAVYERARGALIGQLRSLDPPLSEDDIDLERNALEAAILRLERDHGGAAPFVAAPPAPEPEPFLPPPPANDPVDLPEATLPPAPPPDFGVPAAAAPEPIPPEPTRPEPASPEPVLSVPVAPPIPVAPPRGSPVPPGPSAAGPAPDTIPPPVRIQARKAKSPPFMAAEAPDAAGEPVPAADEAGSEPPAPDGNGQRQRPRIEVVGPRDGRSRLLRNVLVGSILIAVIGLIAVAAFLLRDKPADLQPIATEQQDAAPDGADSKFADRVGGDAAPSAPAAPARRSAPASTPAPIPAAPNPAQPDLAVTQRAMLYEETVGGGANAAPTTTQGRVVWRLDTVPGEQGQQLETVVRASAEFPEAGLTLAMTLRRNLDATLPASHTVELVFTPSGPNAARHNVQDIGLLQGKDEEGARGSPVAGLPVRVRENLFLIGLSSLPNDVERNTDILLHKNWFDITLKFAAGPRGIVAFEKGSAGTQVLQSAFDQWR